MAGIHAGSNFPGKEEELWAAREIMMKPWLDMVTHRIMLRRDPSSGRGPAARVVGCRARWLKPQRNDEEEFLVQNCGVMSNNYTPGPSN